VGVRLVVPDHVLRLPVLRTLPLRTCCRHYPVQRLGVCSLFLPLSRCRRRMTHNADLGSQFGPRYKARGRRDGFAITITDDRRQGR